MDDFDAYVLAAWPRLLRSAWLLTGDWQLAEDLVQTVLVKVHGRWTRIRGDAPDAYIRRVLATTYLNWWRRRWRGEVPTDPMPERSATDRHDGHDALDLQDAVRRALARLPRQQRAVLMLRFHADLTEVATAQALGIGLGTVKSHTARAMAALRADPSLRALLTGEAQR